MANGLYAARMDGVSVSAASGLIEITSPSTAILEVTRMRVGQSNQSASEQNEVLVRRMSTASTGTSMTPVSVRGTSDTTAATARHTITADGTPGATIFDEGFNLIAGWEWVAVSEYNRIIVPPSGILQVKLDIAPAAARTMYALIEFIEKG